MVEGPDVGSGDAAVGVLNLRNLRAEPSTSRYNFVMSDSNLSPTRTADQVMAEIRQLTAKLTVLQFELRTLRNPSGKSFADLEGILAGEKSVNDEIESQKFSMSAEREKSF